MSEISNRKEYLKHFSGTSTAGSKQVEALKYALDIRKFEIELYWKRAAYFWAFIAAAFAGYFVLQNSQPSKLFETAYLISCLGLVFSISWYLLNRGSKAWQRNWESHVDLLEDEVIGPLYKTGINRYTYKLSDLTEAFPFSVSKVNQILSLFISAIWFFLVLRTLLLADWSSVSHLITVICVSLITIITIWLLFKKARTKKTDAEIDINLRMRKYVDTVKK